MPIPTYEELWNKTKIIEKENQRLSQTIEILKKDAWIYKKLIESVNSIILRIDPHGNVKFINAFAQEFFGYPEREILGQNVIGTIVPQTESSGRDLAVMIKDLGCHPERYINNENENTKADGQKVWIAWTNKVIKNEAGNISEILCVGNDISQRREADKALQESEKKFRSVTEQSPNMIFINKNGKIDYCNKKCEEIMGYTVDEFCSQNFDFLNLISPQSKDAVRSAFDKHMKGKEVEPYEYGLITKDGQELNAIITTKMIQYEGDNAILGIVTDITQRKKMETTLKESEAKFRALTESAPAAILIVVGEHFLYVNPAFELISGFTQEEALTMRFWEFVHPDMRKFVKERGLARQRGQSSPARYELKALTKDGQVKWIDVAAASFKYGGQSATLATAYDITERKLAERELREGQEKIARLQKMESLGLLAGGVAHDLNNVLSGIVSYPELLLLDLPENSRLRKPIETMQKSGHRAVAIVQDLLTVARGVATMKEPLDLNDIIREYLESPEFHELKEHHPAAKIKTNLDTDLLCISGSPVHIRKVVMNLVSNAAEAIEVNGTVAISTVNRYIDKPLRGYDDVRTGEYAVLAVFDDGSGISSEDLERIFEPFYTKKVLGRSGTGLGLAVVWNVVQDQKGYIDVQSTENGTTFELYFPITRETIADRESSLPIGDYKGAGETILVVDDVATQREIACAMLSVLGYKTTAVSSGEEAVDYLQAHTVDLILLDMIMDPGINGRETYERVIKIHPNQKAIITSGFAETDDVREAQRLGAGPYIKKPLTLEKIGFAIKDELKL
jgi:PAS domain S-box-containing protein